MHEKTLQSAARTKMIVRQRTAYYVVRRTHVHTPYIPLKTHAIEDF